MMSAHLSIYPSICPLHLSVLQISITHNNPSHQTLCMACTLIKKDFQVRKKSEVKVNITKRENGFCTIHCG
jgi:hypothetical protein